MRFRLLAYILFFLAIAWLTAIFVEQIVDPLHPAMLQIERPDLLSLTADGPDSWPIFFPMLLNGPPFNPLAVKLTASDANSEGRFGHSVSVSGDVALVGAYPEPAYGLDGPGTVYFYRWNGSRWVEEAKQSSKNSDNRYGSALSVSGDVALIADPYENNRSGEVYLYRFNGSSWEHAQGDTLRASDGAKYAAFGSSVSIYDNVAVVGANSDGGPWEDFGSAYVYRWDGTQWQEESKLVASDRQISHGFGSSVSIYGNVAFIGAPDDNDQGTSSGAVYVYRWDGTQWQEESKLVASDGQESQHFGSSVSLYDEFALVGVSENLGYLFQWNGSDWQEVQKLEGRYSDSNSAVSLRRHLALVGASLYHRNQDGWQESQELIPNDRKNYSMRNLSVSLADDLALIGSGYDDDDSFASGTAYVHHLFPGNVPLISVSPSNFQQAVIEGEASTNETLSIQNNGTAPLEWSVSSAANWLTMTPTQGTVMPSDTFSVTVMLSPRPPNVYTNTLMITSNALNKPDTEVPLHFRVNKRTTRVKVLASDGSASDGFGSAVSLSHNTPSSDMMALIGAPFNNQNGAAYLYRWDGLSWLEEAKLTASDGASGERFGSSVSLDGEWAIVGALGEFEIGVGAAYLFRWNGSTWQQEVKLLASDGGSWDNFGRAVSLSGDVALVASNRSGYIYRFNGQSWQEEAKLVFWRHMTPEIDISVSLSGDLVLVSGHQVQCEKFACYPKKNLMDVYRWNGSQWSKQVQLPNSGQYLPSSGQIVWDVATNGEQVLIGKEGNAILYRFDADNWQQEAVFEPSDGVVWTFGKSVALAQDKVLIGQYLYHWDGSEWIEEAKLGFGNTNPISLSDDVALAGAYFYHLSPENGPKVTLSVPHMQHTLNKGEHTITELTITNPSTDTLSWQASISDTTWLNITPTFGTLMPNQSHPLSVTLDAAALEMGHYTDTISFTMDPPLSAALETSVRLTVLPAETKLSAEQSRFGEAVSLSGEVALVGSPADNDNGDLSGAAHLYRWDGSQWIEGKLRASDGSANDRFGSSVSLDGEIALIGAPHSDQNLGAAYVYRWNGTSWQEEAKLTINDKEGNKFGETVSLNGDLALVSAPGNNNEAAYLYRWDGQTWQQEAKLLASDENTYDQFGASLFLDDELAFVGAPSDDDLDLSSGAVYVYRWNGTNWIEEAKLTASDGSAFDDFGSSISFSDNRLLIGAIGDDDNGESSGSVYIYRWDGANWVEEAKLSASDGYPGHKFGASIALNGDTALIGAPEYQNRHRDSGAAYLYRWDGQHWIEQIKLTATDASSYDYFGAAVSLSGNMALVGRGYHNSSSTGAAYLYQLHFAEQ